MEIKRKRLSPAEIDLMQHLWNLGSASVTTLQGLVNNERDAPVSRNTIQVQLQRLEEKGWINHTAQGRLFIYEPIVSAKEGTAELTENFRKKVFGGSALALVRCLVEAGDITETEISELRKMIQQKKKK